MKTTHEFISSLDAIYSGEPWFGEPFQTKLKDLTETQVFRKPKNGEHSIAEIVAHTTFWRNAVLARIEETDGSTFTGDSPENWPALEVLEKRGWRSIKDAFDKTQSSLIAALKKNPSLSSDVASTLAGTLEHDIYHLGQIGFIKKLVS